MKRIATVILAVLALSVNAYAQGKGNSGKGPKDVDENNSLGDIIEDVLDGDDDRNKHKNKGNHKDRDDDTSLGGILVDIVFGDDERETIRDYYRDRRVNVDTLPPGIAKNLQRGKPLPPGIAKKQLPTDLNSRLRDIGNLKRVILGRDVAIIDEEQNIIVDIIKDVLNG